YGSKHDGRNRVTVYRPAMMEDEQGPSPLPAHASIEVVQALMMSIDLRDGFTASHCEDVARFACAIAAQMGLSAAAVEMLRVAGLVHDVGKIAVPVSVLLKHGPLTADEWSAMQQHTLHGERLLAEVTELRAILPLVRSHHERLDGSGYPDGLRAGAIPLLLRILSVADVFEAYTAKRPYHAEHTIKEGIALLQHEAEAGRLDAAVVAALSQIVQSEQNEFEEGALLAA
ncbi:MAG: HD domain-containing protein, partial [Ktedonobacterales bacterium]|nr:HD domain-containing protein [Ktedonobacterales bacterium]